MQNVRIMSSEVFQRQITRSIKFAQMKVVVSSPDPFLRGGAESGGAHRLEIISAPFERPYG